MSGGSESQRPEEDAQGRVPAGPRDSATSAWSPAAGDASWHTQPVVTGPALTPEPTQEVCPPQTLGRYELQRKLGEGGFGAVFVGRDTQLGRLVAIKVPRQDASAEQVESFLQEARRLAQLRHPGIVTVHDVGVKDGWCYIVSDYLQGLTLQRWLNECKPSWQAAAGIVAGIAEALAHAHAHRIVHRDVKPENVILTEGLTPVLVDFGLSLSDADNPGAQRGLITGTLPYMSPEQLHGVAHRIDGRTDIYSLGVVLYRMLCGRLPFTAVEQRELWRQILDDEPQPPRQLVPELPRQLEDICLKALAKREEDRYRTAADLATDLRQVLAAASPPTAPWPAAEPAPAPEVAAPAASAPAVSVASRRIREAERRQITMLCCRCELRARNPLAEPLDLEEQHEILNGFQRLCDEVVQRYAGTVVSTAGDQLLICFGYPISHEDAVQRAVRTGLDLLQRVSQDNTQLPSSQSVELAVAITIHTGLAVVGEARGGTRSEAWSIVGDVPQVVTRLQNLSSTGSVLVSQATARLLQGSFRCESLGTQPLPGLAEPITVYHVTAESDPRGRTEIAEQTNLTPLVGRDLEVSLLQEHWADVTEGQGHVVLLSGEAGLGKSRLVQVLKRHVLQAPAEAAPAVIEWRCSAYYQNTALYPAIDFLQGALEYGRDEPQPQRLAKLEAYLQNHARGKLSELVPLFAALLSIACDDRYPPLTLSPAGQKQRTLDALCDCFQALADHQPVLFILEDLHWVDPSTLEFLELFVDQIAGQRIMVMLTFRPEFAAPWTTRAHQSLLALNRLRKQQVAEMMQRQTGAQGIPAAIVEQIVDRTGGIPLFVEEFTRMLLDDGGLKVSAGAVELTSSFTLSKIPASLQDLLAARLDRMASVPDVVQMGATLGRDFGHDLIRAALDLEEPQLREELKKLVTGEILYQKGRPPHCTYQFKHALLQEAAYQSLLKKTRHRFHQRVAQVLEEQFSETANTQPELLAHHFTEAGQAERAIPYWLRAGLRSQKRSANREAIGHFECGLRLLAGLPPSPQRDRLELDFRVPLGVVLMAARGYATSEVGDCFHRARQLCVAIGATVRQFYVMRGMWAWRLLRDELDICSELAGEVLRLAESPDGAEIRSEAYFMPGNTCYYLGDFTTSLRHLQTGWALFDMERAQAHALHTGLNCGVTYLCQMALALWQLGFPDQAFQRVQEALALADQLKHPFSRAFALYHLRRLQQYSRLEEEVSKTVDIELALAREQGYPFREAQALMGRGACLLRQGRVREGREQLQLGEQGYQATGARLSLTHHYSCVAEAFWGAGMLAEAQTALEQALAVTAKSTERYLEAELLRLQGELLLARPADAQPGAQAADCFRRALEIARRQHAKSRELRVALSWSRWLQRQGQATAARALLQPVYEWFTEGHQTPDLIDAQRLLAELS